jgi:hypothetical protein
MATHTIKFDGADIRTEAITTTQLTMNTVPISAKFSLQNVTNTGNTTTEVVQFTNSTTGLVTTSNVVVGGDLIVGGTSLVNAIYPVGTVIDRATAITDTHLNGKYKAFLAAPDQEWELVSDGQNKVLENLTSLSNTTSLHGRATIDNVTTYLNLTTTWQLLTGSSVNDYVPPVGTNSIIYKVRFHSHYDDSDSAYMKSQLQFKVGTGSWTTVTKANRFTVNYQDYDAGMKTRMWIFKVNSIDDASVGSFAAARPTLSFRTMVEENDSSQGVRLHYVRIMGTDTVNGETADTFTPPIISVTAIGTKSLEYKRTV